MNSLGQAQGPPSLRSDAMNGYPRRSASDLPPSVPAAGTGAARGEIAAPSYGSARRAFRIIDRVSRGGEGLEAKGLARAMGISTSTCYQMLNILIEEGYVSRLPHSAGYRLGPTVSLLYRRSRRTSVETVVGPVLDELARRSRRAAFFGLLNENDDVVVAHASVPRGSPPVGIPPGLRAPSHALALGKIQIAAGGVWAIDRYLERHSLDSMTPRTITDPVALEAHLKEAHARGFATESEEFAKNLYGVAVPLLGQGGEVEGAIGLAAVADPSADTPRLVELARQATATLSAEPQERRSRRVRR
jgi:DNA-binding IclR family transcriptional regulator